MFRNLTPHDVCIYLPDGTVLTVPREEVEAPRVPLATRQVGRVITPSPAGGVCLVPVRHSAPAGPPVPLPDPELGVLYIVSRATAEAAPERADLLYPDDAVRDERGRIVGCRALGTAVADWEGAITRLWLAAAGID